MDRKSNFLFANIDIVEKDNNNAKRVITQADGEMNKRAEK